MKKLEVTQENYKVLTAFENKTVIGSIVYPKWYSTNKGVITIGEKENYALEPKGFWSTKYDLVKDNAVVLSMKSKWQGSIELTKPIDPERPYNFKGRGLFKNGYTLTNYKGEILLEIVTNFSWKKMYPGYTITCGDTFGNDEFDRVLIMLSVHFLRAIQNQAAAAGS